MTYDAMVKKAAQTNGLKRPPLGSRVLGIVHTCIYDAWAAYDNRAVGTQLGDDLRQPYYKRTEANRKIAVNYAAYDALSYVLPEFKADFDAKLTALGGDPANTSRNTRTAAGVAHTACDAVIDERRTDGSNQENEYADTTGYVPFNPVQDVNVLDKSTVLDPMRWTPLSINGFVPPFATPQWGDVKPFAIKDPADFMPPPPPAYGSKKLKADIKTLMDHNVNLTDRKKVISEYWLENSETPMRPPEPVGPVHLPPGPKHAGRGREDVLHAQPGHGRRRYRGLEEQGALRLRTPRDGDPLRPVGPTGARLRRSRRGHEDDGRMRSGSRTSRRPRSPRTSRGTPCGVLPRPSR